MDLGAAGILQGPSAQALFQIILSLIEQMKEVVPGSDHTLLCEETQMISFTLCCLARTGPEYLGKNSIREELWKLG